MRALKFNINDTMILLFTHPWSKTGGQTDGRGQPQRHTATYASSAKITELSRTLEVVNSQQPTNQPLNDSKAATSGNGVK